MYNQQIQEDLFYMMFYGAVAMMSLMASCYLLFRRANAIAPDVTSSVRLRRWTAAFFASMTLSHLWYLPILYQTSSEDIMLSYIVGAMLDFMTLIPSAIILLFVMLQDRRRPLWPVCLMVAPPIVGLAIAFTNHSIALLPIYYNYFLLLGIGLSIYVIRALRQYGCWLRNNYADLEHKEVWQSFIVLASIMLVFGIYAFGFKDMTYHYLIQLNDIALICYLLWRAETLSDLSIPVNDVKEETREGDEPRHAPSSAVRTDIGLLLNKYCEEPQLYLQHDLTLLQLAQAIGTNRSYLSQYFSSLGINYNGYINDLRINHFIRLYHEAVAAQSPVTAQQLATESGYRSYNTFRDVFKRKTGQSVTAWLAALNEEQVEA